MYVFGYFSYYLVVIALNNLIAHRGRDSSLFGENTKEGVIDSFDRSYVSGVEIDVRITKDNKIVVIHDMTINRTSNGYGFVGKMPFWKLRKYNFGTDDNVSRICLLKDILKVVPDDKIVLIEVKCEVCDKDRFVKYFVRSIKSFLGKNIYAMSFNSEIIRLIKEKCPFVKCGFLIGSFVNYKHIDDDMDFVAISSYSVSKVSDYSKPVFVWAINSKKRYFDLLSKMNSSTYYIVDFPGNFCT